MEQQIDLSLPSLPLSLKQTNKKILNGKLYRKKDRTRDIDKRKGRIILGWDICRGGGAEEKGKDFYRADCLFFLCGMERALERLPYSA